jgi:hypothetical protein
VAAATPTNDKARPVTSAVADVTGRPAADDSVAPFLRAPNEDDDGYDPWSDRPATREPLFEPDPWD